MSKNVILYASLLCYAIASHAVDFRMSSVIWTFNYITELTQRSTVQNLGGIYYQGQGGSKITAIENAEGYFSDGEYWSTDRVVTLTGSSFNEDYLEGARRIAGVYREPLGKSLAFNVSVPGECYAIIKIHDSENAVAGLYYQYRGFDSKWTHSSSITSKTNEIVELKIEAETAGTVYLACNKTTDVYAVRFIPNGKDTLLIEKSVSKPVELRRLENGNWFADFGKDAFGQIELQLPTVKQEGEIVVHLGECLSGDEINRAPGGYRRYRRIPIQTQIDKKIYHPEIIEERGRPSESIHMPMEIGDVLPFRYCEIEGYNEKIELDDIRRITVNYKFDDESSYFHSDNDTLNQIFDFCKYSIKATTYSGYYVDGDRERVPYEADALINQLGHYANDTEFTMARRTFQWLLRNPTWPTEWIMQTVLIAWNDYLYSGDKNLLENYVELLKERTLLSFVHPETRLVSTTAIEQTEDLLRKINRSTAIKDIVDWPQGRDSIKAPMGGEDDGFIYTDFNAVVNAYHYEACKRLSQIYEALGRTKEAEYMSDYCDNFKAIFNEYFLDKESGLYKDGISTNHHSLHSNMFALCFKLVPDEFIEGIRKFVESKGMVCSVYGSQFLLDALYDVGSDETGLKLLTSNSKRSWLNMLAEGSTMTMEAWGNDYKPSQDWNHAWGAAPANIIPFRLVGIRPIEPGFAKAEIKPQLSSLRDVTCRVPTVKGGIYVDIHHSEKSFTMEVRLPEEMRCDVYLPLNGMRLFSLCDNGKEIVDYNYKVDGNYVVLYDIHSNHSFELKSIPTNLQRLVNPRDVTSDDVIDIRGYKSHIHSTRTVLIKDGKKFIRK